MLLPAAPASGAVTPATAAAPAVAPATATVAAAKKTKQQRRAAVAVRYAGKQIGDPYRWGGNGPGSWDCSGLVQKSWRKGGVKLPRTTQAMYRKVKRKVSYRKLRKGDLIFFYSGRSHVGIYVGKGRMIHAPSSGKRVKRVKLKGYYKRNFHGAVRPS